jgi:hypothetical protein
MVSGVVATPVDRPIVHDLFSLGSSFYVPPEFFSSICSGAFSGRVSEGF